MPLVSVIIPTHNRADVLPRAVQSVLAQTLADFECIVVDDASTDGTAQVAGQFADARIVWLRHDTNRGASAARNTGIARARGDLIAFLDDDDEWLPEKLQKQVALLQQSPPDVGMVYCWMDYYEQGRVVKERHATWRGNILGHVLDHQRIGGCPTLLLRREVVERVGGFDAALPRANDADFIARVCRECAVDVVPEVLVRVYVDHGHPRLSHFDATGVQRDIVAWRARLEKFRAELPRYPRQTANIHTQLAHRYSLLRDWRHAVAHYRRALVTYPLLPTLYADMARSVKYWLTGLRLK